MTQLEFKSNLRLNLLWENGEGKRETVKTCKKMCVCLCSRQAGHIELAERLVECQYELTDRLAFYLCGRRPGNPLHQFVCTSPALMHSSSPQWHTVVAFIKSPLLSSDHKNGHYIIPQMADRYGPWDYCFVLKWLWVPCFCMHGVVWLHEVSLLHLNFAATWLAILLFTVSPWHGLIDTDAV